MFSWSLCGATEHTANVSIYLHFQLYFGLKWLINAWRHSLAIGWWNFNDHQMKEGRASSYTVETSITCHFLEFGPRWPILMHKEEKDYFTDSKHVPLWHRTFEQFGTQVFTVHHLHKIAAVCPHGHKGKTKERQTRKSQKVPRNPTWSQSDWSSMPTHTDLYFHWSDTTISTICNFIGPSLLYTLSVILLVTKHRL